jgi:hypothetical protein
MHNYSKQFVDCMTRDHAAAVADVDRARAEIAKLLAAIKADAAAMVRSEIYGGADAIDTSPILAHLDQLKAAHTERPKQIASLAKWTGILDLVKQDRV